MSIASVVLRGFGPDASIGGVVLRGYFDSGSAPVTTPTRRRGGWDREIASEVERLRSLRKKDDRERREAEKRLTGLIEAAYNRALGIEPEVADEIAAAAVDAEQAKPRRAEEIDQPLVRYDWNALARHLDGLDALLARMDARKADEAEKRAVAFAMAAEEDDIEMLLMMAI